MGDAAAYQYAEIHAQWGEIPAALDSLEMAYRLRDPGLSVIKVDGWLDPLRKAPRFQKILTQLAIPD